MVLVTGGTGLVGSHLLFQLAQNDTTIIAMHRKSSDIGLVKHIFSYYTTDADTLFAKITWMEGDITDIPSLQKVFKHAIRQVYHCAAMISFNSKDYHQMRKVNIKGTANLVNLSLEHKVEKFCYVSSIATLDEQPGKRFVTEESEWNAEIKHHGYAISKYGGEMEVWRASQEGLDMVIVNPGVILGPGLWGLASGKLFTAVANGLNFYTEGVTGFISVDDVVQSMLLLMGSAIKNERFVLVAENRSFKDIVYQIADGLVAKKPRFRASKGLMAIAWRLDALRSLLFSSQRKLTKHTARSAHNTTLYNSEKLKHSLGYDFQSIEETILRICSIYKSEKEPTFS